ncbi:hypothetical protein [Streptodolium elevatio]|uniref:Uncharacterized protein n=1 Tax=Streptodolium elevatio TaxID=3157996 RepID=A0ABV3DGX9_9ACTN
MPRPDRDPAPDPVSLPRPAFELRAGGLHITLQRVPYKLLLWVVLVGGPTLYVYLTR